MSDLQSSPPSYALASPDPAHIYTLNRNLPPLNGATVRLWNALAPIDMPVRRALLTTGVVSAHAAGSSLGWGNDVAVVVQGCLALEADESGLAAGVAGPGDIVGLGVESSGAGAWITGGELYRTSLAEWLEQGGEPALSHLLHQAEERRAALQRRLVCAQRHRATPRLADLFMAVHETAAPDRIGLSQESLGAILGLRRTTVNASSRALAAAQALRTRRGQVRVLNAGLLRDLACGCRKPASDPTDTNN